MRTVYVSSLALLVSGFGLVTPAGAQPLGTFRWQLQPYCNVVTLAVVQQGGQYQLDGTDDQCGGAVKASVVGLAFQNPSGSIGFGLTIVTAPGGTPVHVDAAITIATLGGTWHDSAGNGGTFIFTPGAAVPGAPRPVPSGGLAANSVTTVQIAPAAVTNSQIAVNAVNGGNIADGTITTADLAAPPLLEGTTAAYASIALTTSHAVIRTVTLSIPSNGTVVANSNGLIGLDSAATADAAICSITTGTQTDIAQYSLVEELTANAMRYVSFGGTRTFPVTAGSFTVRLVCRGYQGSTTVYSPILNALFIPN